MDESPAATNHTVETSTTPELYWKIRALSQQHRAELAEGQCAMLQKQLVARLTHGRLLAALSEAGMKEDDWEPDDVKQVFRRRHTPAAPEAPPTN